MKQTLTTDQAATILFNDYNADWSYHGAFALIEYLEGLEQETETEFEIDPVALRCEYDEYDSFQEAAYACGFENSKLQELIEEIESEMESADDPERKETLEQDLRFLEDQNFEALKEHPLDNEEVERIQEAAKEWLEEQTTVIPFYDGVIVECF